VAGEVPHCCHHPGIDRRAVPALYGRHRQSPAAAVGCNTLAADGMVVQAETDRVKDTRRSLMDSA
jgi:NADH dehydrogenase/NADH:ubiquinone oxidoreductase subunit G